jgi:hypothetical protein
MTATVKNLGQAARYGMLVRVTCRKCEKVANFTASDLAPLIETSKFWCKECDRKNCEIVPFEDDRDRVNKKRIVWRPVPM